MTEKTQLLNEALSGLQVELGRLKGFVEQLNENKQAAQDVISGAAKLNEEIRKLAVPTSDLVGEIIKVDFPSRLSAIKSAIDAHDSKIELLKVQLASLERSLASISEQTNAQLKKTQQDIGRLNWLVVGLLGIGLVSLGLILFHTRI